MKTPNPPTYLQGQDAAIKEGSEGPEAEGQREKWSWGREGESCFQPKGNSYRSHTISDIINIKQANFSIYDIHKLMFISVLCLFKDAPVMANCSICKMSIRMIKANTQAKAHVDSKHSGKKFDVSDIWKLKESLGVIGGPSFENSTFLHCVAQCTDMSYTDLA